MWKLNVKLNIKYGDFTMKKAFSFWKNQTKIIFQFFAFFRNFSASLALELHEINFNIAILVRRIIQFY